MKTKIIMILLYLSPIYSYSATEMYEPKDCPVVGNTTSNKYHVAGGRFYAKMLRKNKSGENRRCFANEEDARRAGFVRSKK